MSCCLLFRIRIRPGNRDSIGLGIRPGIVPVFGNRPDRSTRATHPRSSIHGTRDSSKTRLQQVEELIFALRVDKQIFNRCYFYTKPFYQNQ